MISIDLSPGRGSCILKSLVTVILSSRMRDAVDECTTFVLCRFNAEGLRWPSVIFRIPKIAIGDFSGGMSDRSVDRRAIEVNRQWRAFFELERLPF